MNQIDTLCSRTRNSATTVACGRCIKCLLYNQRKIVSKIPKTPNAPKINRKLQLITTEELIPKYDLVNPNSSDMVQVQVGAPKILEVEHDSTIYVKPIRLRKQKFLPIWYIV